MWGGGDYNDSKILKAWADPTAIEKNMTFKQNEYGKYHID